jgi:S1-C subfamily serine protease
MKKQFFIAISIILALSFCGCGAGEAQESETPVSLATNSASPSSIQSLVVPDNTPYTSTSVEEVSLSVVSISGVSSQGSFMGTGFIISEAGYIVALKNLIEDSTGNISVSLSDGRDFNANVIGGKTDIAILKISGDSFIPVEIGDSSKISVGDKVVAIRNNGETIEGEIMDFNLETAVSSTPLIQTDIELNLGDGGCPLADQSGRVIGITFMQIFESEKPVASLSIPVNDITSIIQEIIDNSDVNNSYTSESPTSA